LLRITEMEQIGYPGILFPNKEWGEKLLWTVVLLRATIWTPAGRPSSAANTVLLDAAGARPLAGAP